MTVPSVDELFERLARDSTSPLRVPRASYRLQLGPDLTFDDAAELADYLAALGISDCYTSPFFETSGAASHGYDVADHSRLRVDMVPNHMGIARARNAWWADVLELGPASRYAAAFDIDWDPVKRELAG